MHGQFDPLCAHTKVPDPTTVADGTHVRSRLLVIAVVAREVLPRQVKGQRDLTAWTANHVSTVPAHHKGRCATAIQEQDNLYRQTYVQALGSVV